MTPAQELLLDTIHELDDNNISLRQMSSKQTLRKDCQLRKFQLT
jgi:hypothetical protein